MDSTPDKRRRLSELRTEDKMDICFWEEVDNGDYYESECNKNGFQFNDGTPYDNGFMFCPYCGKPLKIKEPVFDEEDI
jgi:rRNA maturation endonuclease Nob1